MAAPSKDTERYKLLYDLGAAFGEQLDLDELIPDIIARCRKVLGAEGASVLLLDRATGELFFPYVAETDPEVAKQLAGLRFPSTQGIAGAVLASGKPMHVSNPQERPEFYGKVDETTGMHTREILAAPLRSRHGPIGVLEVINPLPDRAFEDDDLEFLEALAGSVSVAIENARLHGELKAREERLRSEVGVLRRDLARREGSRRIIGTSEPMREAAGLMESAAASQISVLIEGETGTGKELVARAIHEASDRASGPFVAVNIAALSGELLESELFGHTRGAFTGAVRDRVGLFEAATGGTILLDEIGELPTAMQLRLLRVLQEGEITPVGTNEARSVNIRVISATNSDLSAAISSGRFREDLYYRLSAFPLRLPPLRERTGDLPLLVDHFLAQAASRHGKRITGIEPAAFERLAAYDWPGNVRELENEIERCVALTADGALVSAATLSMKLDGSLALATPRAKEAPEVRRSSTAAAAGDSGTAAQASLKQARAEFESAFIREALEANGGNVSRTARALGLSRVGLQKRMKALGLRGSGNR